MRLPQLAICLAFSLAQPPTAALAQQSAPGSAPWQRPDGGALTALLTASPVTYEDGSGQVFFADGRTVYRAKGGAESWGKWWIEGGRYCSSWPPSDRAACYDLDVAGQALRFISDRGEVTPGRFGAAD